MKGCAERVQDGGKDRGPGGGEEVGVEWRQGGGKGGGGVERGKGVSAGGGSRPNGTQATQTNPHHGCSHKDTCSHPALLQPRTQAQTAAQCSIWWAQARGHAPGTRAAWPPPQGNPNPTPTWTWRPGPQRAARPLPCHQPAATPALRRAQNMQPPNGAVVRWYGGAAVQCCGVAVVRWCSGVTAYVKA
jgi:hypothetical protein